MSRFLCLVILFFCVSLFCGLLAGTVVATPATADGVTAEPRNDTTKTAAITELYPNPAATNNPGEFVTVRFPPGVNRSAYEIADPYTNVTLSTHDGDYLDGNQTSSVDDSTPRHVPNPSDEWTEITYSTDANRTAWLTDRTVAPFSGFISLADDGDHVRLLRNGTVIDELSYDRTRQATVYDVRAEEWSPLGATEKPVIATDGGTVEAFVLPDNSERAVEFLESAEERIIVGGYTLSDDDVVKQLVEATERGVSVEVLVDGSPVGGMTAEEATALDTLDRGGISVRVLDGEKARYRFHHPKYALVDDRALVTTENWKPAGTGGQSSRGWAVITEQSAIVQGLRETYEADSGWVDTVAWSDHNPTIVDGESASGSFPTEFNANTVPVDRTELLLAPDNAEKAILDALEAAEHSIDVKQVQIGDSSFPFLQAVLDAAERGVTVRILLSSTWYARDENARLRDWLNEQARIEDLPLEARLAEPGDAYEKIHAKGIVIDRDRALVGSINWNNNSVQNNREVALLLEGRDVAGYYREVFEADWKRDETESALGEELPLGLVLGVAATTLFALLGASRLEFGAELE